MKTRNVISLLIFLTCTLQQGISQQLPCGSDETNMNLVNRNPAFRDSLLRLEGRIQNIISQGYSLRKARTVYTIPVVVHVIHSGESVGSGSNISDRQIQQALAGANDRFRNLLGKGIDTDIEFCLASRDPNGNITNGIVRVNGSSVANYFTGGIDWSNHCPNSANELSIKSLSRWPHTDYYNIWIVKSVCNGQWGGYAYYPGASSSYDGAVIVYNQARYSNPTIAHELGHAFNLYHTFYGDNGGTSCPDNFDCLTDGDRVCDTPPHKIRDCSKNNPCSASGIWSNSCNNYMSYCWPATNEGIFTQGQKDRMIAVLSTYPRAGLLNSGGCGGGTANDPCNNILAINGCGASHEKTYEGGGSGAWYFSGDCGYDTPGKEQIYSFVAPASGTYHIGVTSASGSVDYLWKVSYCSGPSGWNCIDEIGATGTYGAMSWKAGTTYYILLDDDNTSSGTHTFFVDSTTRTSVANVEGRDLKINISPNPNAGRFNIHIQSQSTDQSEFSYQILNMLGKRIFASGPKIVQGEINESVELESIRPGIYLVQMTVADRISSAEIFISGY